jgi:hypothetical protein
MTFESFLFFLFVAAYVLMGYALLSTWLGGASSEKKLAPVKARANRIKREA